MRTSKVVHISGKVQGVYFRASTQQQAISLGITGYARNLLDGDVEVIACGEQETVDKLISWLHTGPSNASVQKIQIKDIDWQEHNFFAIA
ncbi:MAG: acylphosphatase [Thalassotalea sp.]